MQTSNNQQTCKTSIKKEEVVSCKWLTEYLTEWVIHSSSVVHFPSRCSRLLFVTYSFIFASCICVIPTTHYVCPSALLLNNILLIFAPICLSPSSPTLTHPSPPLGFPSAPAKHVLIFCCQPTSLAISSYFSVQNYCLIWPPFLLTFGQHLLFGMPFNLMKQYTRFSNFKVVLTCMLCPYQSQGGSSPVSCDVHNAKWKKIHLKVLQY